MHDIQKIIFKTHLKNVRASWLKSWTKMPDVCMKGERFIWSLLSWAVCNGCWLSSHIEWQLSAWISSDLSWVDVLHSLRVMCFALSLLMLVHVYELLRICHISFCSQDMICVRVAHLLSAWPLVSAQWRNSLPKNEMLALSVLLVLISSHMCMLVFYCKTQKGKTVHSLKNEK